MKEDTIKKHDYKKKKERRRKKCLDCNTLISPRKETIRCGSCSNIYRWKDKEYNIKMRKILSSDKVVEKIKSSYKKTCLDKYGVDNAAKVNSIGKKISEALISRSIDSVKTYILSKGYIILSEYIHSHKTIKVMCKKCSNRFTTRYTYLYNGYGLCPKCFPNQNKGTSKSEKEIVEFLEFSNNDLHKRDRKLISPKELDIVIPSKSLAIEYCGLFWHSSGGNNIEEITSRNTKSSTYHLSKLLACESKGYRLITIFEDEWELSPDKVKNQLEYALGTKRYKQKFRASQCKVKAVDSKTRNAFLKKYHLQNGDRASISLGLYHEDLLLGIMSFSKPSLAKGSKRSKVGVYELSRFCAHPDYYVHGLAAKLLKYFKENYEWQELFTYCDRRWSTGKFYENLGFSKVGETKPNYWYWDNELGLSRVHRFNFRKSNLKNMKSYDKSLTEKQIMALEGYSWIYDCGNLKFSIVKERKV